MFFDGIGFVRL